MVRVQDQQQVQGLGDHRVHLVLLGRQAEAQAQEVLHQVHGVVRVQHGLADGLLVRVSGDDRQLGHQADGGELHLLGVERVQRVLVERGQRRHCGGQHRHRVGVAGEAAEEALELLVQQGVAADLLVELVQLGGRGQVAVDQQVGHLEEAGVLRQLLDGVPAVAQDARIAVDVGDGRGGCCGVHEAGVKGDSAGLLQQLGNVVTFVSFNNLDARELELATCMVQGRALLVSVMESPS